MGVRGVRCEVIIMYSLAWRSEGFHHGHDLLRAVLPGSGDQSVCICGREATLAGLPICGLLCQVSHHPHQIHTTGEP